MPHVYIIRCSDGTFYTGSTKNLEHRVAEHEQGVGARYTAVRRPLELVYAHYCERVEQAFAWEKQIQGWNHAKKQALIDGRIHRLTGLAECHNASHARLHGPLPGRRAETRRTPMLRKP